MKPVKPSQGTQSADLATHIVRLESEVGKLRQEFVAPGKNPKAIEALLGQIVAEATAAIADL
jgi:hypothetical protein